MQNSETVQPEREQQHFSHDREEVIILHDSLCGKVNETILSREQIITKKIWAPNLKVMESKLDDIEDAGVIVVQALTRDTGNKGVDDIYEHINDVVTKASSKARKVVISTVINREDERNIREKVDLVNAHIKYKYINDEKIIICDNQNLNDPKFRVNDGIHLTPHGISVLATNLKYKIAEALDVKVIKKENGRRNRRYDDRLSFFNDGRYSWGLP